MGEKAEKAWDVHAAESIESTNRVKEVLWFFIVVDLPLVSEIEWTRESLDKGKSE